MEQIDITIIGAGVIGIAIARRLALDGRAVLLLEQEDSFGQHSSSRNSEVIHAGMYYPTGSLKARFCVEGNRRLYDYCGSHHIEHRRCGKLIVAADIAQETALASIKARGDANGVEGLRLLEPAELSGMEPSLTAQLALYSPNTGIVDSHGYMLSLLGEATAAGALVAFRSKVTSLTATSEGIAIALNGENAPDLTSRLVINAAGLFAPDIIRLIEDFPPEYLPRFWLARGNYFALQGRAPFRHLIYPLPQEGGLGVHLTLDLAGQARFGPDVEWIDHVDYAVNPARSDSFYDAIRSYWPGLRDGALAPSYAGIRPKIAGPGMAAADFRIDGPATHGMTGLINLFGIESPGLTASLPLADHVAEMVGAILD